MWHLCTLILSKKYTCLIFSLTSYFYSYILNKYRSLLLWLVYFYIILHFILKKWKSVRDILIQVLPNKTKQLSGKTEQCTYVFIVCLFPNKNSSFYSRFCLIDQPKIWQLPRYWRFSKRNLSRVSMRDFFLLCERNLYEIRFIFYLSLRRFFLY